MDDNVDLDFDDDLSSDAKQFEMLDGISHWPREAQGDALPTATTLEQALRIAQEVYGETNSTHSGLFCHWVQAVLEGGTDIKATEEMLELLHEDKERFGGRVGWKVFERDSPEVIKYLRARRHASICAMNIVRAVLNKARGQSYLKWVEKSLWRAVQAEGDIKSRT